MNIAHRNVLVGELEVGMVIPGYGRILKVSREGDFYGEMIHVSTVGRKNLAWPAEATVNILREATP